MIPIYGHESFETAYKVDSYPYGRLRCKIWFWLEYKSNKGFRAVHQTENPKTERMNAPKQGPYHYVGANMYLDMDGHVQYKFLNEYSKPTEVLEFLRDFPKTNTAVLKTWCLAKHVGCRKCVERGVNVFGKPMNERELTEYTQDRDNWKRCYDLISQAQPAHV